MNIAKTGILLLASLSAAQNAPPDKCLISGTVVDSVTGAPVVYQFECTINYILLKAVVPFQDGKFVSASCLYHDSNWDGAS
jgi:hypothetical protein